MVELIGTERQVTWANDIRARFMEELDVYGKGEKAHLSIYKKDHADFDLDYRLQLVDRVVSGLKKRYGRETSAQVWIENRNKTLAAIELKTWIKKVYEMDQKEKGAAK